MGTDYHRPNAILYAAVCRKCGADDCRYDRIAKRCGRGRRWEIIKTVMGDR